MKQQQKIKTDLFRFITLRTPQQLSTDNKEKYFIFFPKEFVGANNFYFKDLIDSKVVIEKRYRTLIDNFKSKKTHTEIREMNPELYDFSSRFYRNRKSLKMVDGKLDSEIKMDEKKFLNLSVMLFEQLIYQVITKESKSVRQACCQMLVTGYILSHNNKYTEIEIDKLLNAKIVIPSEIIRYIRLWQFPKCKGLLSGVNNLGIADFRKVEQEVCCYVPGEVSHIENILAREYKERSTRNHVRTEFTIESTSEREIENLSDVTTATRNELSTEISSVIDEDRSSNYGGSVGVEATYMGATINTNAYADFANSNSISQSNSNAKNYSEEVTRRALEKIVQKTTEKRTSKIIKEFEDNNKHGFDNREGDKHVTGIYRWLDIIYKNRLVNYGKRLMLEFSVPEPAEFYKRAMRYKSSSEKKKTESIHSNSLAPNSLEDLKIYSPSDITRENYHFLASTFNIYIDTPLAETELVVFVNHKELALGDWSDTITIPIKPNYEANKASRFFNIRYGSKRSDGKPYTAILECTIGGVYEKITYASIGKIDRSIKIKEVNFSTNHRDQVDVVLRTKSLDHCTTHITIHTNLQPEVFAQWQNQTYFQLNQAYNTLLAQYQEKQRQDDNENELFEEEQKATNPAFNRITEQRELKRACIELITKPFCREQGKSLHYDDNKSTCELVPPSILQNSDFEDYVSQVKFLEQAFDWNLMSYLFYPYYWAGKCDWVDLLKSEDDDLIFQAFKQAGMARVVVPVRPEFNRAVSLYLATGDIWLGGDLVAETDDDLHLSIADELETVEGAVEEEWETRVPTSLAIVQSGSALLNEEGLPCCDKMGEVSIKASDNKLAIKRTE
jgi:hypothetical protein